MADGNVKGYRRRDGAGGDGSSGGADGSVIGGLVVVGQDDGDVAVADSNSSLRYGGGKSVAVATVTASGDTTVLTPGAGNAITLYWISAINDPDELTNPLIKISLGAEELYRAYAVAHWEVFTGATDASLVINLSDAASVAVTAHYEEGA